TEIQADQTYSENTLSSAENYNHRLNARIEHQFNGSTSFIVTPRMNLRTSDRVSSDLSMTMLSGIEPVNRSIGSNSTQGLSYSIDNNFLLRHRFEKRGRTISANFGTDISVNDQDQLQNNETFFYADEIIRRITDQNTDIKTDGYDFELDVQYTEPVGDQSQ